jgi:hypothetical protein
LPSFDKYWSFALLLCRRIGGGLLADPHVSQGHEIRPVLYFVTFLLIKLTIGLQVFVGNFTATGTSLAALFYFRTLCPFKREQKLELFTLNSPVKATLSENTKKLVKLLLRLTGITYFFVP